MIKFRSKILYIFRGLPGSGKSTAAKKVGCIVVEPQDNWATRDGQYNWTKEETMVATGRSISLVESIMKLEYDVAIAEILPQLKDLDPYLDLADYYKYTPRIYDLKITIDEAFSRNTHDVPKAHLQEYARMWEDYSI